MKLRLNNSINKLTRHSISRHISSGVACELSKLAWKYTQRRHRAFSLSEIIKQIGYVSWLPNRQTKQWERSEKHHRCTIRYRVSPPLLTLLSKQFSAVFFYMEWNGTTTTASPLWSEKFAHFCESHIHIPTTYLSLCVPKAIHASPRVKPPPTVHMHEENKWKFTYNADQTEMESQQKEEKSFFNSRARSALRPVRIDLKSSSSLTLPTLFFLYG